MPEDAILLYDGECGFCSRSALFVFRRDPHARVRFAALHSAVGKCLLAQHGLPDERGTLVLVDARGAHVRSTGALRVARLLRWPWSWAYAAIIVPRAVRQAVYRLVANHRRRLGPAVDACARPTPELRARTMDQPESRSRARAARGDRA